jgi:hypothetical protein
MRPSGTAFSGGNEALGITSWPPRTAVFSPIPRRQERIKITRHLSFGLYCG